jgi:predicted ribosome quality control (RQC) complex YloA/Tae2 family protein
MANALLQQLHDDKPGKDDRRILQYQHGGYIVMLGKNSFSNERLIADHPHKECLWMHAMAARGSHVILCLFERPEPSEEVIRYAAGLALEHSHSQARTVSVSLLRDVFKPEGSGVGIWKTSRSMSVEVPE